MKAARVVGRSSGFARASAHEFPSGPCRHFQGALAFLAVRLRRAILPGQFSLQVFVLRPERTLRAAGAPAPRKLLQAATRTRISFTNSPPLQCSVGPTGGKGRRCFGFPAKHGSPKYWSARLTFFSPVRLLVHGRIRHGFRGEEANDATIRTRNEFLFGRRGAVVRRASRSE